MAKQVVMPQMGESVAEGTIVRWLKKVGDAVERDEPLFEISTDKVDAEIPSPSAGVLSEVKVKEGETVPINTVVGVIDGPASKPATAPTQKPAQNVSAPPVPAAPSAPSAPSAPAASAAVPQTEDDGRFGPYAPVAASSAAPPPAAVSTSAKT